jgi:hypothetical protein
MSDDQEKIKIAREYFMRAEQGRPDILELFQEDAEVHFPKFGFGFGRNSFLEMVKGFEGALEFIQHDYDRLTFIPSADYLIVEGTSHGRMSGKFYKGRSQEKTHLQRLEFFLLLSPLDRAGFVLTYRAMCSVAGPCDPVN